MASVNDLKANQALELSHDGVAAILPEVKITAKARGIQSIAATGAYVFGTGGYVEQELDLSSYILNQHITIKSSIPFLPTNGNPVDNQGDVRIQVNNGIHYLGALQEDAILDPDSIQDSIVVVSANCGSMDTLQLYRGRVIKAPQEQEGSTTFSTKSILWEIIDEPVSGEVAIGGSIITVFAIDADDGTLQQLSYTPSGNRITFHHGITIFNEYGDLRSSVENTKRDQVDILRVDFVASNSEPPILGKYTIKFTSATDYTLTHPDKEQFTGNINTTLESGSVRILASYWDVIGEPTDAEITFFCSYTVEGNPITIVKNLLYKGLSGDWGNDQSEPTTQSVDWDRFSQYETYFNSKTVYVSETNKDNSVFDPFQDGKPLRIRDFCQRILDHVGAQLTFNSEGQITMNCDWYLLPNEFVPTYQTAMLSAGDKRAGAHVIDASGPTYNRMVVKYGQNLLTGDYGGSTTFVDTSATNFSTLRVSLPYYKASKNDHDITAMNCTLWEIVKASSTILKMKIKPNWGLPVAPGDKFEVSLSTQPVLPNTVTGKGQYWQIHQVSKRIGGIVEVEAHMVPRHGQPLLLCNWELCTDSLGTQVPVIPGPNSVFTYTFPYTLD